MGTCCVAQHLVPAVGFADARAQAVETAVGGAVVAEECTAAEESDGVMVAVATRQSGHLAEFAEQRTEQD